MKILLSVVVLFLISGCTKEINIKNNIKNEPHSFKNVWDVVSSNPLKELPQNNISYGKLTTSTQDTIMQDAKRTLLSDADILEPFDKLVHPNGICFKGVWSIDKINNYSGYFKKDTKALIIVRASTALSNTTSDTNRAFGFAGKIFPTMDESKINKEKSANFFLIDDLGGTDAKHYTDVVLTNEPKVSFTFEVFKNLLYAIKVKNTFEKADSHAGIRQLYEISQLEEGKNKKIITPKWMKLEAKSDIKIDKKDFRDELKIQNGDKLIFNISVANKEIKDKKNWEEIGTITLDSSVVSNSCDHRLHFHHPKYRDDLRYSNLKY